MAQHMANQKKVGLRIFFFLFYVMADKYLFSFPVKQNNTLQEFY